MTSSISSYLRQAQVQQREERILSSLPLVKHAIGRLSMRLPPGADRESLESAGMAGLVEAADRFDESAGVTFSAFAYKRIQGAIYDEIRKSAPYSQDMGARIKHLVRIRDEHPFISLEEQAAIAGLTSEQALECLRLQEHAKCQSLFDDEGRHELSSADELLATGLEKEEQIAALTRALQSLTEKHRQALVLFYYEELRNNEIAEVMNLSPSRTSRLLEEARLALRNRLQPKGK